MILPYKLINNKYDILGAVITGVTTFALLETRRKRQSFLYKWPRAYRGAIPEQMSDKQARKILGVPTFATNEYIKQNYQKLIRNNHPDRGGSVFISYLLTEAYRELQK